MQQIIDFIHMADKRTSGQVKEAGYGGARRVKNRCGSA